MTNQMWLAGVNEADVRHWPHQGLTKFSKRVGL